jgi:UDP-3-O-[3-hydroxymyristoyl] glucosamine N-acyltransferase
MSTGHTLEALGTALGVEIKGNPDTLVTGVSTLQNAAAGDLSFLANPNYRHFLETTKASVVITSPNDAAIGCGARLISTNPYATWAKALELLNPPSVYSPGVCESAIIDPTAQIHPTASIGSHCVIGAHCVIGEHVRIGPQSVVEGHVTIGGHSRLVAKVYVGESCHLGARVIVHPGVVIGADGFGLALDHGHWRKVQQLGCVLIGDDCEIGANTTIDRGALGNTVLGNDVRIDNQVQIAHNVQIGDHTAIAGCVGIAGSTTIGAYCMIAGACGIGGHLTITDKVIITAMSTVLHSIESPGSYGSGIPAQPHQQWKRILVRLGKLDDWFGRLKKIEKGSKS